jgi:hypothetical protein
MFQILKIYMMKFGFSIYGIFDNKAIDFTCILESVKYKILNFFYTYSKVTP